MESILNKIPVKKYCLVFIRGKHLFAKAVNKKPQNFILMRATSCDYDSIIKLMRLAYYPEEPICSSIVFKPTPFFEDNTIKSLTEGYTIVAKCKYNGDILGACINETTHSWDPDIKDDLACKVCDEKSRQLLHFSAYFQRAPDLWNKYGVLKIFEMAHLFVRKDQRGKGLALKLMQQSRLLAADSGFPLIRVDASSHYTSRLCQKMRMKLVKVIQYCSYVGADKRPIFNPPEPHTSLKTYIDDEPQKNAMIGIN